MDDAAADCEAALEGLRAAQPRPDLPADELALTRYTLLNNRARLAYEAGDRSGARSWQRQCEACEEEIPPAKRPAYSWLSVQLADDSLEAAIRRCETRLAAARLDGYPDLEALYAHSLGDLFYRFGDARTAHEHFCVALGIWQALGDYPEDVLTAELNCAVTAFRAGLLEEAEAGFARVLRNPLCAAPAGHAEVLGAQAMLAAREADPGRAEALIREALDKARESGEPDVLVRVLRSVGEAYSILNRVPEARGAFAEALSAAEARDDTPVSPEDLLGVLTGLAACGDEDPSLTLRALLLAPTALDDVNAWWDLPRLLPGVVRLAERGELTPESLDASAMPAAVGRVVEAASQRSDCENAVAELRRHLRIDTLTDLP